MKPEEQENVPEHQLDHPVNDHVGGADDARATAQQIGSGEIEAVAVSAAPLCERRLRLREMRAELVARRDAGHGDLQPLIDEIDRTLARLPKA
ncbi:hypothetical protein C8N35_101981 [Breoghania corrubedonensis]|uniref:Uncharacterized protein n=1 Tax=Breoghania corrubedonensis TaxID=665038 RepID=A0A2T5VGP9_9HYPH|nr:hypothetical protein [Breoghania corrubedonensis]PTW62932.1 hypothetical protein C8N35_101981 [Breoghania corrubedonensis]